MGGRDSETDYLSFLNNAFGSLKETTLPTKFVEAFGLLAQ
jgi:hypothetical protein